MNRDVVISNSILNCYKFRVLTSGIDTTQYARNPILLWMHNRPFGSNKDNILPIGKIDNLRLDGDNLIGTLVFDSSDDFAKKIEDKWDGGFLKMVSVGLDIIELSEDPAVMLPGQTRMTITKSKLKEVSVVDIGANDDALALSYQGRSIELSSKNQQELDFLSLKNHKMKSIALMLGLADNASEQLVESAISQLKKDNETLRAQLAAQNKQAILSVVDNAVKMRQITEGKRTHFIELGEKVGIEALQETLSLMTPIAKPSGFVNTSSGDFEYKKLSEVPADVLLTMRKDDPSQYAKLYKAEYGIECTIEK